MVRRYGKRIYNTTAGYKNNPLNQGGSAPKLTDPTTPGTCIEFPAPWIEWIEEYATNGRIISGG